MISVVIPVFNESGMLKPLFESISICLTDLVGSGNYELIFVDNGSSDGSDREIYDLKNDFVTYIGLDKPDYGEALKSGLLSAKFEWVYIINVDFWDPIFLNWAWSMRRRHDYFIGSKRLDLSLNKQHFYRKLLSWGLNLILRKVFHSVTSDTHGQKLIHLPFAIDLINSCKLRRGQFDTELTLRATRKGLSIAEAPVPIEEIRAPRNFMISKILRNIKDISMLWIVMRSVEQKSPINYTTYEREDLCKTL